MLLRSLGFTSFRTLTSFPTPLGIGGLWFQCELYSCRLVPSNTWWRHCLEGLWTCEQVGSRWRKWMAEGKALKLCCPASLPVHSLLPDCRCHVASGCWLLPSCLAATTTMDYMLSDSKLKQARPPSLLPPFLLPSSFPLFPLLPSSP